MNIGRPAPEPMNTASKSSSSINWSMVVDLPITTFVSNLTPSSLTFSISFLTTFCFGRRNSGIPYTRTPPSSCSASNTVTSYPSFARSPAQVSPDGPEPMTATLCPFVFSGFSGLISFSSA